MFNNMIVQITEEQYRYFVEGIGVLNEGVDWSKNDNGTINFSINHKTDNNSNKGTNSVDTRVFGTKNDILHGKVLTKNGNTSGLSKNEKRFG